MNYIFNCFSVKNIYLRIQFNIVPTTQISKIEGGANPETARKMKMELRTKRFGKAKNDNNANRTTSANQATKKGKQSIRPRHCLNGT